MQTICSWVPMAKMEEFCELGDLRRLERAAFCHKERLGTETLHLDHVGVTCFDAARNFLQKKTSFSHWLMSADDFRVSLLEYNYASLSDLEAAADCADILSQADATMPGRFEQWQYQAPYRRAIVSLAVQTSITGTVGALPPPPRMQNILCKGRRAQIPDSKILNVSSALNSI